MPITGSNSPLYVKAARLCRTVAVALYSGLRRGQSFDDHEQRVVSMPVRMQAAFTGGILSALFLCSLFAAQFGLLGLAIFWLAVIFIIR